VLDVGATVATFVGTTLTPITAVGDTVEQITSFQTIFPLLSIEQACLTPSTHGLISPGVEQFEPGTELVQYQVPVVGLQVQA
jgi:hypothetical protein